MDKDSINQFLIANSKYFHRSDIPFLQQQLEQMDANQVPFLYSLDLKDPTTILIVSLVAGNLGIDRFLIGQTGLGVAKLLTCGGFIIWAIVDWFLIMDATRDENIRRVQEAIGMSDAKW